MSSMVIQSASTSSDGRPGGVATARERAMATNASPRRAPISAARTRPGVRVCTYQLDAPATWNSAHPRASSRRQWAARRSEEHTSELQSREKLVCRLLLEKKKHRHRELLVIPF